MKMNHSDQTIPRRDFIKLTTGSVTAAFVPATLNSSLISKTKQIPIGVQLYCVRKELAEDMPGTISALAKIGFEGVEFADYFGRSATELRRMLDDNKLKCCGTHIHLETLLGDKLSETVEFNQTLGNKYLIVRSLKQERRSTKETFLKTAELFNEIAERLKPHGMRVGYHNHDYIFEKFDGEMLWNILANHTRKDVILQLDTGNASVTGVSIVELLQRHPGRTVSMHVKPYSKAKPNAFLGADELDWKQILRISESSGGIEWYIVEYEREAYPPLEALKANLAILRKLRK
ncbi:MAG: sugar phosphate isomerase/epimerase [Pyrinomonadaceae bacterium]|nr:sugar phosphate isomerase/epimerase [Pyrinomonadaceae bacterium]